MQYAAFSSNIELPFFTSLASLKINHDKLDDSSRKILGLYEIHPASSTASGTCNLQILGNALTTDESSIAYYRAEGIFKNVNTLEDYKNLDRHAVIAQAGRLIWDAISDGTIFSCPSLLASFTAICYADLKKYKFTYWFAFPALHCDPLWKAVEGADGSKFARLSSAETEALVSEVQTYKIRVDARQRGFFLAKKVKKPHSRKSETEPHGESKEESQSNLEFEWKVDRLGCFEEGFFQHTASEDQYVAFVDPSTFPENPGWLLRNLLALCQKRWGLKKAQILCYRDTHAKREVSQSLIFNLETEDTSDETKNAVDVQLGKEMERLDLGDMPKVTGWERNYQGKLASKVANLGDQLDPKRLADQSVDLNLKLMKWRIAPGLDLDGVRDTKVLLLGAGTLGSYVARNLLGWGVRHVTFVDNGRISFSNPVRQPLYTFEDCLNGGKDKAIQAAEALRQIYPGVTTEGHTISVPMAGHPVLDEVKTRAEFEKLQQLFDEHDIVFQLMDTRESRWLPTVMGKSKNKLVINAALGFDTYMVMRHGVKDTNDNAPGTELGCYFCNDVVAPADSMKDQTLDQQCTVTRPGIAAIASALAVELAVSVLQHPHGPRAAAPSSTSPNPAPSSAAFSGSAADPSSSTLQEPLPPHPLGLVPHQLRGFLSNFSTIAVHGPAYDCCSACSPAIVAAYEKDGWEFVKRAMNEKGFVEELSGLAEVQRRAEAAAEDVEWDSEGEMAEEEGEGEML